MTKPAPLPWGEMEDSRGRRVPKHRADKVGGKTVWEIRDRVLNKEPIRIFMNNPNSWHSACLCGWGAGTSKHDGPLDEYTIKFLSEHYHFPANELRASHRPDIVAKRIEQGKYYDIQLK